MSESFGAAAARLCGAASMMLGWRPHEFWQATPAELANSLNFAPAGDEPPDGETIEALKRRFPDI